MPLPGFVLMPLSPALAFASLPTSALAAAPLADGSPMASVFGSAAVILAAGIAWLGRRKLAPVTVPARSRSSQRRSRR